MLKVVNGSHVIAVDRAWAAQKYAALNKPGPRVDPERIRWAPLRAPLPQGRKDLWLFSAKEGGDGGGPREQRSARAAAAAIVVE